ncbi:MAG: restriction endonuclease [Candidatus Nanohalobium sp.]
MSTEVNDTEELELDEIPPIGVPIIGIALIWTTFAVGFGDLMMSVVMAGAGVLLIAGFVFKSYRLYQIGGPKKAFNYALTAPKDRTQDYSVDILQPSDGIDETEKGITLDHLRSIDYNDFEDLVAKVWENKGYETKVVPDGGGDGGIDVIAKKNEMNNTEKVLIQAKRNSKENKVSSPKVREYSALKNQEDNVDKVYVVTTSDFTKNALDVAQQNNVKTLNGKEFLSQYQKYVEGE